MAYFVGHDLGTGGVKTALVDETGATFATAVARYPLHHPQPKFAEQDPDDFWRAVCETTRSVLRDADVRPDEVAAMTFAGQMLALVPLAADGTPTRRAVSWLDARADEEARRIVRRIGGEKIVSMIAGATPTGKDLVAKIAWIAAHEPEIYARTHAFCDATGYLVARATGRILADQTAAGAFGLVDPKTLRWSRLLAALVGTSLEKLPPIRLSTEVAGELCADAAAACGLRPKTKVAVGMADIPAAAVGSGAIGDGEAHVYLGTSSWIGVTLAKSFAAPPYGIASVPAGNAGHFLAIGESETAGACVEWLAREVGPGGAEIGPWLDALGAEGTPGANGLLFLPWMFGERSPVPDTALRGAFVNLSLEHRRADLLRAVYEGVALNLRWILDAFGSVGRSCRTLRAIGGGARSDVWSQVLADVTGRTIERVALPQQAGATGAALTGAVAVGVLPDMRAIKRAVRVDRTFVPRADLAALHAEQYEAFREIQPALSRAGRRGERIARLG